MPHIHVANSYTEDAYVFIAKKPEYRLADIINDLAEAIVKRNAFKARIASDKLLHEKFDTVEDLYATLVVAAEILSDEAKATPSSTEAAKEYVQYFKKLSKQIAPGMFLDVKATSWLNTLKPSGIAAALGAKTFNMIILTGEGKKVITFDTNYDFSWIVTAPSIVRAKYGHLWIPAPASGEHKWEGSSSHKPVAEHGGFLWRVTNDAKCNVPFHVYFTDVNGQYLYNTVNSKDTLGVDKDFGYGGREWDYSYMTNENDASLAKGKRLILRPGQTNGWGEAWGYPDYWQTLFRLMAVTREARGYVPFTFMIPVKFMQDCEITVMLRGDSNIGYPAEVRIMKPGLPMQTILVEHYDHYDHR